MGFKGTAYVGQDTKKFGGLYRENKQPNTFGGSKTVTSNMGSRGDPASSKGSMLGQKWKSTCKGCSGKLK